MKERKVRYRLTTQEQECFRRGIEIFYEQSSKSTLKQAFLKTIEKFFSLGYELQDESCVPILPSLAELPTLRQFYHFHKEFVAKQSNQLKRRQIKRSIAFESRGSDKVGQKLQSDLFDN